MKKRTLLGISMVLMLLVVSTNSCAIMKVTDPNFMDNNIAEIEQKIPLRDELNPSVSKVDVAWHLDHSLKTINRICDSLFASNPDSYRSSINISRILSLSNNYIPRGKAQSPKVVLPPEEIRTEDLYIQLEDAKKNLVRIFEANVNSNFRHPVFGLLNRGQALRFIEVHTEHHLKIMRDILEEE